MIRQISGKLYYRIWFGRQSPCYPRIYLGQDGAIYFHEGTFHHSQVETPYGPVRASYGATFRYEPRAGKLSNYIAYPYNNPGEMCLTNGVMHLIGDASDGKNYYATPLTSKIDYPASIR